VIDTGAGRALAAPQDKFFHGGRTAFGFQVDRAFGHIPYITRDARSGSGMQGMIPESDALYPAGYLYVPVDLIFWLHGC
jgi:hypothetical protein